MTPENFTEFSVRNMNKPWNYEIKQRANFVQSVDYNSMTSMFQEIQGAPVKLMFLKLIL